MRHSSPGRQCGPRRVHQPDRHRLRTRIFPPRRYSPVHASAHAASGLTPGHPMPHPICVQCGTEFGENAPPAGCVICQDIRQYVRWGGQAWTTLEELRKGHAARIEDDHGLLAIESKPNFGIGQRALVVPDRTGNILWDCVALLDNAIIDRIRALGGLTAIAISHCHYYTTMIAWSEAFGDVPIYLHENNRKWVLRPDRRIEYWSGETLALTDSATLYRVPGH